MAQKKGLKMFKEITPIKQTKDCVILKIPNEFLFSIWTLPENIEKDIGEMIPIAIEHIRKINEKIKKTNKKD